MNATPRFHINGPVQKPVFENDLLVSKEMLEVHVTTDHRIIDGIHSYQFGQTLEKITAQPDRYFI
jgi:pyruvate/2-oxoglutarate dehydrogenase complex dihydrolipoamide acyltransferase (E2) component